MLTTVKNNLKKIDKYFFNCQLYKQYCQFHTNHHKAIHKFYKKLAFVKIKKTLSDKIDIFYLRNNNQQKNLLGQLFDKYGSTKSGHHYYEDIYDLIFSINRDKINLVLECGIGNEQPLTYHEVPIPVVYGAGLRTYKDYFCNAQIIGIDINPNVIFHEERINTYICDQSNKESIKQFINRANLQPNTVDIIIDDGSIDFLAKITLFQTCIQLLKNNGIYLMENIHANKLQKYIIYFNQADNNIYQTKYTSISDQEYPVFIILITKTN